MSDYTPTTEQVRAFALSFGGMRSPEHWDNWLAAHDREVAARAWDEGYDDGIRAEARDAAFNPHREGGAS